MTTRVEQGFSRGRFFGGNFVAKSFWAFSLVALVGCGGAAPEKPIARSLLGQELFARALPADFEEEQSALLATATVQVAEDPQDIEAQVWRARRLGYLGRYDEAIETLTAAMAIAPDDARLYRHRGHRFLTLRRLDEAIADFTLAHDLTDGTPDRIEPDGLPNAAGIPTSTLQTNIAYHRGLAWTCLGEWEAAQGEYARGFSLAENPDMKAAMAYWWVLNLWHLDRDAEARLVLALIDEDWPIIENEDYHAMLLAFAGEGSPVALLEEVRREGGLRFATVGYGVGEWLWRRGDRAAARDLWIDVVRSGPWPAFGALASEAALRRRPLTDEERQKLESPIE